MSSSTTFFLLAILLISFSQAKESPLSKLSSFLQSKVRASDAVDSVLNLLNDLRQANVNEQTAADDLNKTQEANGLAQIAELTGVRDRLRKAFDDAIAHREFIQQELKNTLNYIDWILNRQRDIINQLAVLAENRCYSNSMFIKSLKEHSDALKVIDELIAELNQKQNSGEALMLTQVNDISSKLKAYTTLFNNGALDQFMELANKRENYEDNDKDALVVEKLESGTENRNVKGGLIGKVIDLLEKLKAHLKESMQNLQDHEIQANFDFANWQASVEAENRTHNAELERKNSYVSKLNVDLDVAKTFEQLSQKEWDQSVKALQDAVNDLEAKRAYYLAETNRRNEENAILDEVLEIFRSKVAGIADYLRTRAEGSTERVARATDNQISSQSGNIAEQVAAEARQA